MHITTTRTDTEKKIAKLREELIQKREEINALRKQVPAQKVEDYTFSGPDNNPVKLSELFGSSGELMVIHNMGKSCRYCTMWADGINGIADHLANRIPFVVISPDDPRTQEEFAHSRGWKFKMVSNKGTTFKKDMGFEGDDAEPWPGVSVFIKKADGIYHYAKDSFGPGDDYCATWHFLDLLPDGANEWGPKYSYTK